MLGCVREKTGRTVKSGRDRAYWEESMIVGNFEVK